MMKIFTSSLTEAKARIEAKETEVALIGLGKMGLPLASIIASAGFKVHGVDINEELVKKINAGTPRMDDEPFVNELVAEAVKAGKLSATTTLEEAVPHADFIIILIPVLIDDLGNPALAGLELLLKQIGKAMSKGAILIIETTMPPGTTDTFIRETLEQASHMEVGKDIGLAFAPERTYSGRVVADIRDRYPKIVGGVDPHSGEIVAHFYRQFVKKGVILVKNARTAEAVKVFKGIYRDINIAIANELALLADALGVNIWDVIEAANTEPFSHIHKPGAGVGGHCIPVYPHFGMNAARKLGIPMKITQHARELNLHMPRVVARMAIKTLIELKKGSTDACVVLLGLAYRGGRVKEHRLTPTIGVIKELQQFGIQPIVSDPLYSAEEIEQITGCKGITDWKEAAKGADLLVLITDHEDYLQIPDWIKDQAPDQRPAIVDSRAQLRGKIDPQLTTYKLLGDGNHTST